jgi:hypothetical protein
MRGEVEIRVQLEFRVKGSFSIDGVGDERAPHPNPLPVKNGAREQSLRNSGTPAVPAVSKEL